MVLVNSPAAGDWTIRVIGTAVNVGNPGQGYALVATADLTEPPVSTGVQDALVVRVKFADVAFDPSLANLQNMMADVGQLHLGRELRRRRRWFPPFRGPPGPRPQQGLLLPPRPQPAHRADRGGRGQAGRRRAHGFDTIERLVIVTNDVNFDGTGRRPGRGHTPCPAGFTRPISVSVHSYREPAGALHPRAAAPLRAGRPLRPRGRDLPPAVRRRVGQHGWALQQRAPAGLVKGARRLAHRTWRHDPVHPPSGAGWQLHRA